MITNGPQDYRSISDEVWTVLINKEAIRDQHIGPEYKSILTFRFDYQSLRLWLQEFFFTVVARELDYYITFEIIMEF